MMKTFVVSTFFIIVILINVSTCMYDSATPDPSTYHDTRPRLVVSLTGFTPGSRVYLRHWEANAAFTYPANYALYIDASGRLLTEIVLSLNATAADVLAYVDQSGNGVLDVTDFGTYQQGIVISGPGSYAYLNIPYQAATLSAYNTTTPLPLSGQKICVYMPAAKPSWSGSLANSMPEYPYDLRNSTLTLGDWFPVSIVSTAAVVQTFPRITSLGAGAWNETCVHDANSNGKYDLGETVTVTGVNIP